MAEVISIESAVKQPFQLIIDGVKYVIEFPLSAVIQAEAELGRSLKTPTDWFTATAKDIPALLRAGLKKHHPDATEETVTAACEEINPEMATEIIGALGALAFPKWTAKYEENRRELRRLEAEGKPGPKEERAVAP